MPWPPNTTPASLDIRRRMASRAPRPRQRLGCRIGMDDLGTRGDCGQWASSLIRSHSAPLLSSPFCAACRIRPLMPARRSSHAAYRAASPPFRLGPLFLLAFPLADGLENSLSQVVLRSPVRRRPTVQLVGPFSRPPLDICQGLPCQRQRGQRRTRRQCRRTLHEADHLGDCIPNPAGKNVQRVGRHIVGRCQRQWGRPSFRVVGAFGAAMARSTASRPRCRARSLKSVAPSGRSCRMRELPPCHRQRAPQLLP